jgi:class 3 adenylate cyclase
MFGLPRLSVQSKLQLLISIASLGAILALGCLCWQKTQQILSERVTAQLTGVRIIKAERIEEYFRDLRAQIQTLAENPTVITAMIEFDRAFADLADRSLPPDLDRNITDYYRQQFLPRLAKNSESPPLLDSYRPTENESKYLQYHYIASKQQKGNRTRDNSQYNRIHGRYQAFFHNIVQRFGYGDLFLINLETGDIVYSTRKKPDFATNLYTGPYRDSNLARLARSVRDDPDRNAIHLVDFQFYRPSDNAPAAFIGTSLYEGSRRVGMVALQVPIDKINHLLTHQRSTLEDSSETYLIGADGRVRSIIPLFRQNKSEYKKILQNTGVPADTIATIARLKTPLLLQPIETDAAREVLKGRSGTQALEGYRGTPVLSSYAPLAIRGLQWGILSEIDTAAAYRPIDELQKYLLLVTAILMSLVTLYAAIAAHRFLKPIERLNRHAQPLLQGTEPTPLPPPKESATDEIAQLWRHFNGLIGQIQARNISIAQKETENNKLLLNILPSTTRDRWQKGERRILDRSFQVSIVVLQLEGMEKIPLDRALDGLNELIALLDERGRSHGLERLNCFGEQYITSCGLTKPHLDHCKRALDFALESLDLVKTLNQKHEFSLTPRIGIHTGEIIAAVLGKNEFHYDIWGETLQIARLLQREADANAILVSETVHERVADLFPFEAGKTLSSDDRTSILVWSLGKSSLQGLIQELTLGLDFDGEEF